MSKRSSAITLTLLLALAGLGCRSMVIERSEGFTPAVHAVCGEQKSLVWQSRQAQGDEDGQDLEFSLQGTEACKAFLDVTTADNKTLVLGPIANDLMPVSAPNARRVELRCEPMEAHQPHGGCLASLRSSVDSGSPSSVTGSARLPLKQKVACGGTPATLWPLWPAGAATGPTSTTKSGNVTVVLRSNGNCRASVRAQYYDGTQETVTGTAMAATSINFLRVRSLSGHCTGAGGSPVAGCSFEVVQVETRE